MRIGKVWKAACLAIRKYRMEHGHVPRSADEFDQAGRHSWAGFVVDDRAEAVEFESAIGKNDSLFILSPAGILSPWRVPYVYENRNGLDPSLFADSPAHADGECRYSIRVDEGVYVSVVGGERHVERYNRAWWAHHSPSVWGIGLLAGALVSVVVLLLISWKLSLTGLLVGAASAACAALPGVATGASCYIMTPLFSRDPREMIALQKDLLQKYHGRGVISDATYQKAMAAIEAVPMTPPSG